MLRGRAAEQARIGALLAAAWERDSGALLVRGEPGIGKTTLLEYAAGRADGMRLLRGAGVESEAELPFAGLHLLLRPALDHLDALPEPQRQALAGAFGLAAGVTGDRFLIGAAVLSLLAEAAEPGPLLCLVDDVQWLDRASAEALLFAARRLDREGVAMLFAVRDPADGFPPAGLPELSLAGLDPASAGALLDDLGTPLPPAGRDRLIAETRGNPLALRELPGLWSAQDPQPGPVPGVQPGLLGLQPGLLGVQPGPVPGPVPLTGRVRDAFAHQVRDLPGPAGTWLLLAAADDTGELAVLARAGEAQGLGLADLRPAEERGLVTVAAGRITFRHPLIRAAVYHAAPAAGRIAAHRALATAYAGHHDPDRRVWHLAAATTGPDEGVAGELAAAAGRATARSGYAAAASAYARAAQLSTDPVAATQRLTLACESGLQGGQPEWARSQAERALPGATDPVLRSRLLQVRAGADFAGGDLRSASDQLRTGAALVAGEDPERACWMLMEAVHAAWALPTDPELLAATVDQLDTLRLPAGHPLLPVVWLARWGTAPPLGRDPTGFPPLAEVIPAARAAAGAAGPRGLARVATMAFATGRDEEFAGLAAAQVAAARAGGMVIGLPGGLGHLAVAQTLLGDHGLALVSGTEGLRIAQDTGQPLWASYASGALAYLAAVTGDEAACRRRAAGAGLGPAAPAEAQAGSNLAQVALALLELGSGRMRDTFDRLSVIATGPYRHQGAAVRSVPDLVEAAVRLGRPEETAEPLERFAGWAGMMRQPWLDALLARCRALLAPEPEAERHYRQALAWHEPDRRPFERARTALLFGEWLRRSRRKSDAQVHLRAALRAFESLDSAPWATRARAELGAAGAPPARAVATPSALAALTPQELQITRLAAQGMSNRDIAAQLFLSPRTVAYHLYKAYPKLGVSSRSELAALTPAGGSVG